MVLGLKEAMWEELKEIADKDPASLRAYGWEEHEFGPLELEASDNVQRAPRERCNFGADAEAASNRDYSLCREKFESMIEQYKRLVFFPYIPILVANVRARKKSSDMHKRISLWYSMSQIGWQLPRRPPLSKAERIFDQTMRKAILEAQKNADGEDLSPPCRSVRLLVGMKSMS